MCLHNMCKRMGDEDFVAEVNIEEQLLGRIADENEALTGRQARDQLVQTLFG